jgi:hypothetical protein
MSTLMIFRAKGDAGKLEASTNADPDAIRAIAEKAKSYGLLRHRFFGTDDEIIVVDEWPNQESFERFFAASPEIQDLMAAVGVTEPPVVTFARELDVPDAVG